MTPEALPLDWKEIEARLGDLEPSEGRQVVVDLLLDDISPLIALSRLLLALGAPGETAEFLAEVSQQWGRPLDPRIREMAHLLNENREGCARVAHMLQQHPDPRIRFGDAESALEIYRRFFDQSVQWNEEASVAAYSLGDAGLLQKVTDEVVAQLADWGLLGPDRRTLEVGCGIGRMQAALSPRVAEACGVDISPKMVETARRRCAGLPNVHFSVSSGRDLADFPAERFELVYAVDSFPYIHQAGPEIVEAHFQEAARVLVPGGEFVILHFSYRDSSEEDRAEVRKLCRANNFTLVMNGAQPFKLWDGVAFRMRKS